MLKSSFRYYTQNTSSSQNINYKIYGCGADINADFFDAMQYKTSFKNKNNYVPQAYNIRAPDICFPVQLVKVYCIDFKIITSSPFSPRSPFSPLKQNKKVTNWSHTNRFA